MEITLKNFQGHSHSIIRTDGGITAITGKSDAGKSSIQRAIELVRTNRPSGDAYIKKGTKKCEVTVDEVTRTKSKTVNKYTIEGLDDPLKAVNLAVPEEVIQALNLSDDNVQDQHDSIFLLNLSSGKVAQKLANLIDLEDGHRALKIISDERKKANATINALNMNIINARDILNELENLDTANSDLVDIEDEVEIIIDSSHKWEDTIKALSAVQTAQDALDTLPDTSAIPVIDEILEEYEEIQDEEWKAHKFHTLIENIKEDQPFINLNPDRLIKKADKILPLITTHINLENVLENIVDAEEQIGLKMKAVGRLEVKFNSLMGDSCPLCGNVYEGN